MLINLGAPARLRGSGSRRFATAPRGRETRDTRRGPSGVDPWRLAGRRSKEPAARPDDIERKTDLRGRPPTGNYSPLAVSRPVALSHPSERSIPAANQVAEIPRTKNSERACHS